MTLTELITVLEAADPNQVVKHGFANPHSYRGDYMDLAFEPATDVTVRSMLDAARSALYATFQGWKGGDFVMHGDTWCWLSQEGDASGDSLSALLLEFMLTPAAVPASATDRAALVEGVGVALEHDSVHCPLCPDRLVLHTPDGARAHFTAVHPEQQITGRGAGPWPMLVDRADICICGHTEQRHFEDVCLTCDCGDFLVPEAAAEVIDRWRQAALQARADRAAVLREAADVADRLMDERYGPDCSYAIGGEDVARELRRMADETPQPTVDRAASHRIAVQQIRAAARGLYADAGIRILAALDGEAPQPEAETRRPAPTGPAPTALRVQVLREILARIDGGSEDSATDEVDAATVRAVLAEILTGMQQQPAIEAPSVVLGDLYRELAEEAAEWGGVITEHEFRRKASTVDRDAAAEQPAVVAQPDEEA